MQQTYTGDTFEVVLHRYSDPERLNAARNAAIYLGKADRDNVKRPMQILKVGHVPEVFRGEHAEFEFINVSKEVYDHLVTYTTRTMRVAGGNRALKSIDYTIPSDHMKDASKVEAAVDASMRNYHALLVAGETKQVARAAMPINANMNPFVFQFNFLTLMQSVFPQRIWEPGAQGNTVKVVRAMWELVSAVDPDLWDAVYECFGPPAIQWRTARRALGKMNTEALIDDIRNDDYVSDGETVESFLARRYGSTISMWEKK